jgi:hypothetical protein
VESPNGSARPRLPPDPRPDVTTPPGPLDHHDENDAALAPSANPAHPSTVDGIAREGGIEPEGAAAHGGDTVNICIDGITLPSFIRLTFRRASPPAGTISWTAVSKH